MFVEHLATSLNQAGDTADELGALEKLGKGGGQRV